MTIVKRRLHPNPMHRSHRDRRNWRPRSKAKCRTETDPNGCPTMQTKRVEILYAAEDDFLGRGVATLVKDIALYWAVYGDRHLELPPFPAIPITHNQLVTTRTVLIYTEFAFRLWKGKTYLIPSVVIETDSWQSNHFHPSLEIRWHATGGSVL